MQQPDYGKLSLSELLDEALRLADEVDRSLQRLFPETREGQPSTTVSLEGLTLDEKLALGEAAARRLSALAFQVAPGAVLDSMESRLPEHAASLGEAVELLSRLQAGK